jgi:hypothetical protein
VEPKERDNDKKWNQKRERVIRSGTKRDRERVIKKVINETNI